MRTIIWIAVITLLGGVQTADAQFLKKLGKVAEKAAERTVERRVANETAKKTDQALDSILEPGKKGKQQHPGNSGEQSSGNSGDTNSNGNTSQTTNDGGATGTPSIEVYSKFDFVPGDKQLFFDDFVNDFVGDFPAKWNTNGSGEIVTMGESAQKWLKMMPGFGIHYIPDLVDLPEDYTIEFDLITVGIDNSTSSQAGLTFMLDNNSSFKNGSHYAWAFIPVGQYGAFDIRLRNYAKGGGSEINSAVKADIREAILNQPHISIAVNQQRFRLWVNEQKYVDVPRFIPSGAALNTLKFNVNSLKDGKELIFISNLKVAAGGVDLRRKLISEGKISTNGILFDSGSANIQPQSMGIIRQISQALTQEKSMKLYIIGHTDSDGTDASNRALSKSRAEAVKNALVKIYNVSANRLDTKGKGEAEPVADNSTAEGKAQNRRVEFIKR
ncbi:MAG: OmpA family protein [Flavobacteriaceae bacterium]